MSEITQDDMELRAEMQFEAPPDLWTVAQAELSAEEFQGLLAQVKTAELTPADYVRYVEAIRQERRT